MLRYKTSLRQAAAVRTLRTKQRTRGKVRKRADRRFSRRV